MLQDGWRGIRDSLNTGRVFSGSILIGADTARVSVIIRNFLSNTIMARALDGRKDSKAATLLHRTPKDANQVRLKRPPLKRSSLLCSSMSLNNKSSSNHNSSTLVCSTNNSLNSTSSRSLSHSHNYNSSTSSNNRNIQVTLKRKKNRKGANNSNGSVYFVKRELVIGRKGNIMEKAFKYEDIEKLLAETDELLLQINSEVISDMEEVQRAQLEEHVKSLQKLKSEVHDKIGNEGATKSSPYSEGMHEAMVDIAKAMKALTSYLS